MNLCTCSLRGSVAKGTDLLGLARSFWTYRVTFGVFSRNVSRGQRGPGRPKRVQGGPQDGPGGPRNSQRTPQDGSRWPPDGPRGTQDARVGRAPRGPTKGPRKAQITDSPEVFEKCLPYRLTGLPVSSRWPRRPLRPPQDSPRGPLKAPRRPKRAPRRPKRPPRWLHETSQPPQLATCMQRGPAE